MFEPNTEPFPSLKPDLHRLLHLETVSPATIQAKLETIYLGNNFSNHHPEQYAPTLNQAASKPDRTIPVHENPDIINNQLYQDRQKLLEITLTENDAASILLVSEILNRNPDLVDQVIDALLEFQRQRLEFTGVHPDTIKVALDHTIQGINLLKEPGRGQVNQLALLISAVHDLAKYDTLKAPDEPTSAAKDYPHLMLHGTMSAIVSGDVLTTALEAAHLPQLLTDLGGNSEEILTAVSKFTQVTVANHDYHEFTDKMAKRFGTKMDNLSDNSLYFVWNQVFFDNYRQLDSVFPPDLDPQYLSELIIISDGIREADMMTGVTPEALLKYHLSAKPPDFYRHPNSLSYLKTFCSTIYEYFLQAPDVLGLRSNVLRSWFSAGVMYTILEEVSRLDPEFDPGLLLQPDHQPQFLALLLKHSPPADSDSPDIPPPIILYQDALFMHQMFTKGKVAWETHDPTAAQQFLDYHLNLFQEFVMLLKDKDRLPDELIRHPDILDYTRPTVKYIHEDLVTDFHPYQAKLNQYA